MTEKKRLRSPSYPYLDLADALGKLELIYEKDKRATTTGEAMLEHMGYDVKEGRSGSAGRALSALRQYGLIEETGGNYRISDDGFHIVVLPWGDERKMALLKQAAIKPPLFEKVLKHFSYDLPSDTTLRSHLILAESFNPDSVSTFIRNLRKTKEFAKIGEPDYNGSSLPEEYVEGEIISSETMSEQHLPKLRTSVDPMVVYSNNPAISDVPDHVFSYQLSFPRNIRAEVRIFGKDLRKQDIERLKKEVGDLAGAFDEETSQGSEALTEVDLTQ